MIRWTEGGTTKQITNNNIVYAKQGADGTPVLLDEIWAVDTSTNPETRTLVYKSNSILKALATSEFNSYSMTGGRAWWDGTAYDPLNPNYYWITYPTTHGSGQIGTEYGTFDTATTGIILQQANTFRIVHTPANKLKINVPVNIKYTFLQPLRVIVKLRATQYALGMLVTDSSGYRIIGKGGPFNAGMLNTDVIICDQVMNATTQDYSFNGKLQLTDGTGDFTNCYISASGWKDQRTRGNIVVFPQNITRTIEIYDPVTGDLITSNTSALSTTYTARAS